MANLAEPTLNRLLRRADWRFLLPDPHPLRSACFAGGDLAKAVELISARTVQGRPGLLGDCDLAVAVDPDPATLRAALESLSDGGSCYTEWYSPTAGGLRVIRRRFEAAGFDAVVLYWFWPPRSSPRYWIPLEAPGALAYFRSHPPPAGNLRRRLIGGTFRAAWSLGLRLGVTLPVAATARKQGRSETASLPEAPGGRPAGHDRPQVELLERLRAEWSVLGLGATPARLSSHLLTGGPRATSKVVDLVFVEPEPRPRLALKRPRVPESAAGLTREAATLELLHASRPGGVPGVPRLVFRLDHAGVLTLGETPLTGRPVFTALRRNNYRDLALRATAWLADLAGRPSPSPRAGWWNRLVQGAVADFEASFGAVVGASATRQARTLLDTLGDLPLVCEQRDFSPWNVLVGPDGELAVLDWESSEPDGLPVLDLFYFLTYLAFFRDGAMASGRYQASYRRLLVPSSFTGRVLAECLTTYVERTGLAVDDLRPLRVFTWMLHSGSEFRRLAADAGGQPALDRIRRSLFVRLFEEELRRVS